MSITEQGRYAVAISQMRTNDPPIKIGQIWVAWLDEPRRVGRRIRILAPYPPKDASGERKLWIYEEMPGGTIKAQSGHISLCPEINLRIVFRPEE